MALASPSQLFICKILSRLPWGTLTCFWFKMALGPLGSVPAPVWWSNRAMTSSHCSVSFPTLHLSLTSSLPLPPWCFLELEWGDGHQQSFILRTSTSRAASPGHYGKKLLWPEPTTTLTYRHEHGYLEGDLKATSCLFSKTTIPQLGPMTSPVMAFDCVFSIGINPSYQTEMKSSQKSNSYCHYRLVTVAPVGWAFPGQLVLLHAEFFFPPNIIFFINYLGILYNTPWSHSLQVNPLTPASSLKIK